MYFFAAAAVLCGGVLTLWLLGLRTPTQRWQVMPGGGFRASPRPGNRIVLGAMLLLLVPLAAAGFVFGSGNDDGPSVVAASLFVLVELVRSSAGPVLVSPAGLAIGTRLFPWDDVHLAYLTGKNVELRLPPRWITWFGDRRVFIHGRAYLVPAAEIHWLIQHYLLFPAQRETMETLPTRAYELRP